MGGQARATRIALWGAVIVPLVIFVVAGMRQLEVSVIERAGQLTVVRGTPYLDNPATVDDVNPYLPGMALFGLPRTALDTQGPLAYLGDARLWCAAALFGCLIAARRVLGSQTHEPGMKMLMASPVVALPLVVSGIDLPLIGCICLSLACAVRGRPIAAGCALAVACAVKWTAWPALAVVVALAVRRDGWRAGLRIATVTVVGTLLAMVPSSLLSMRSLIEQVFAFPTGQGVLATPAASPLPGKLLADLGAAGRYTALALLAAAAIAVAVSLVVRPPLTMLAAADRLSVGLCAAFLLAPAGRFGYFAVPIFISLWARLVRADRPRLDVPGSLDRSDGCATSR